MSAELPRRRARWVLPTVVAVVVLAAAGVVGYGLALQRPGDPASVAGRFWNLVADGKAREALALTSTPSAPNGLLLTDQVYGKADRGISNVTVHAFARDGDTASGTVSYTVHGTAKTAHVELRKVSSGFLRRASWQIQNAPLATVQAHVDAGGNADSLAVDGTALPLTDGGSNPTIAIPALPGSYTFALGSSSGLFNPVPQTVAVTGDSAAVTLRLAPSHQLASTAVAQAQAMLSGCFSQPSLSADCPVAQGIRNVFDLIAESSVSYQLTQAPKLAFNAKTMEVTSTSDGTIMANGSDPSLGAFHNTAQVSFALDVAVHDGKIVLTAHQGGVTNDNLVLSSRD